MLILKNSQQQMHIQSQKITKRKAKVHKKDIFLDFLTKIKKEILNNQISRLKKLPQQQEI